MNPKKIKQRLEEKRTNAMEIHERGLGHLECYDYRRAAIEFYEALKVHACAQFYYSLAFTMNKLGNYGEALHCYQEALKDSKFQTADHYYQAGMMARDAGLNGMAAEYLHKARDAGNSTSELYLSLGNAYIGTGRLTAAAINLRIALNKEPNLTAAKASLALIKEKRGDVQGAKDDLEKLLDDESGAAVLPYADVCHSLGLQEKSIPLLERQLVKVDEIGRRKIHFLLGKQYDAIGEYKKAFENYTLGNMLKQSIYRPAEREAATDKLIRKYPQAASFKMDQDRRGEGAIFIVGMPRSGTTLTEQILSRHPDVHAGGEWDLMSDHEGAYGYLSKMSDISLDTYYVTNKNPYNFGCIGQIQQQLPGAKIIHCTRGPRDTMLSIFFQDFVGYHPYAYDLKSIEHYYLQYVKLMSHWAAIGVPMLNVKYEETVADVEAQARRLIDFLGIKWDDACAAPHKSKSISNTASWQQVRKPVYTSSVGRWGHYKEFMLANS